MKDQLLNLSDPATKVRLVNLIKIAKGDHRVSFAKWRGRRSDRQNRWYFGCFCSALADFLTEQGQPTTVDEAHELMKFKFLRETRVVESTGELIEFTRSTTSLTTEEFGEYLEACACWLADTFHIEVPEPSAYREASLCQK